MSSIGPVVSVKMLENIDGRTDGRSDDGVIGILLGHTWAFGPSELITEVSCVLVLCQPKQLNFIQLHRVMMALCMFVIKQKQYDTRKSDKAGNI